MRQLAEDLWVVDRPMRFGGVSIGTRMTVVRLPDGGLFIHSPVALDDELRAALVAVGTPRWAIAPNRFHHLYVGQYRDAFPDVSLFAAPGLPDKRKDLRFDAVLGDAPAPWVEHIDQQHFAGLPMLSEVAFCHRASRTLLTADLAFNLGPEAPWGTRLAFRMVGAYGKLGPTLMERFLIRDREAARRSLEAILAWDFDRVIVTHGAVLETGGREGLRKGYRWLLGDG